VSEATHDLGLEVRAGVHTGEIERDDGDVHGVAVHAAARIMGHAGPGEVLVSTTTKDLVAGSGFSRHPRTPAGRPLGAACQRRPRVRWTSRHGAGVLRCDVPADANATLVSFGALGHGIARDERAAQLASEAEASR